MPSAVTHEDLDRLKQELLQQVAPAQVSDDVIRLQRWKRVLDSDRSSGRLLTGPQWIDGNTTIRDGTVTARKLEAELIITNVFIAGAVSPADRMEIDANGQRVYGTVSGTPNTQVFNLTPAGNLTIGVSPNQLTFVAATGVLTVPAAVISGLDISDVASGNFGGTYSSTTANPKIQLSTAGIRAFNSGGTQTYFLDASNGNWQMVGTFTLASSTTAADRLQLSQGGIELWKASTRQFYLQAGGATNAITMLLTGPNANDYVGLNPTDGIWMGASTFAAATKFKVTPQGVLTATTANISGAITATSGSITGNLSVTGVLTLGGSGRFETGAANPAVVIDTGGIDVFNGSGVSVASLLTSGATLVQLGTAPGITVSSAGVATVGGWTATANDFTASAGSIGMSATGTQAFWAGNSTPGAAPFRVTAGGAITATSGAIGGWTLGSLQLTGGDVELHNNGRINLGTGIGDWLEMTTADATYVLWAGHTSGASAAFSVSKAGAVVASSATITGNITANTLDANAGTLGGLTVDGALTIGLGGSLRAPGTSAAVVELDNTGLYGRNTGGTARFQVLVDGSGFLGASTTLSWTTAGVVSAAGFTMDSGKLSSGTGGSFVTVSSGATAFSAGGATPASAPFNVSNAGALTATSATITGAITATSGRLDNLTVAQTLTLGQSGVFTGRIRSFDGTGYLSSAIYMEMASSGTGIVSFGNKFNWDGTNLALTGGITATSGSFTGAVTIGASGSLSLPNGGTITSTTVDINGGSSGAGTVGNMNIDGTITLASGGKIIDADGSFWDQTGITLVSSGIFGDTIKWKNGGSDLGSVYATASAMVMAGPSGSGDIELFPGEIILRYNGTNISLDMDSTNRRALFGGFVYPGSGSGTQTSRYLSDNGTYMHLNGPVNIGNSTVGGSAANWSSFTTANIPDKSAGYLKVYVNGVLSRIPFWADA